MKIIISLILAFLPNLILAHPYLKGTDGEANKIIEALSRYPRGLELIDQATKEGPITFKVNRDQSMSFGAMWQCGPRLITIEGRKNSSLGLKLRHLIFELHNAVTTKEDSVYCERAANGQISVDQFVMEVERIEHQNVLRTAKIINQGIKEGYLPKDTRWDIVHDFKVHYQIQQLTGHSDAIAEEFRRIAPRHWKPYRGTIAGLKTASHNENAQRAADLYWNYYHS